MILKLLVLGVFGLINALDRHVLMTEVFDIMVDPPMFNWTYEEIEDQYVYEASLLNAPDLPSWINFVYSKKHRAGFLYGVPPKKTIKVPIEIIALNKKTYETKVETINIIISQKMIPARYEVHLKIDNLNVEDILEADKMDGLKRIFQKQLWSNSARDLYVTFLGSAVELGARKPLNPIQKEGVVVRLGSYEPFTTELQKLHEEVGPLRKILATMNECPRDFKRTSVEVLFRNASFTLDWCNFRLIDNDDSDMHHSGANEKLLSTDEEILNHDHWQPVSRMEIPQRTYGHELLVSILVPTFIMIILASVLSFVLCFHHDDIEDEDEEFFENLFHICTDYYYDHYIYRSKNIDSIPPEEVNQFATIQKATNTIRNLSKNRDINMSPDPMLLSRSHTNSPTSTLGRGVHCRPSPPPYIRPKFKPEL